MPAARGVSVMPRTVHINSARAKRMFRELDEYGQIEKRMTIKGHYPDGKPVAEVAAIQEFGTAHIPSRPFARMSRQRQAEVAAVEDTELNSIIHGNRRAKTAAKRVAQKMAEITIETIDRSKEWAAPNAPATVQKKGNDHPLVDTGRLRDSVHWQIGENGRVIDEGKGRR